METNRSASDLSQFLENVSGKVTLKGVWKSFAHLAARDRRAQVSYKVDAEWFEPLLKSVGPPMKAHLPLQ